ncbi:hypothetical protein SAMN05216480_103162 [Pustulibacterium marinum]|uniref:Uncharacterized protein n=1 Tax=Pustulibacterium marinum TaxID=1224947 RepID=A0A1I7G4G5_9FLAO|nr:hypothetical protein [Pustulibacterium marinum]SFU43328.1 hypothetical protein SAMN05216480_103162 [Pustulibacterium marinum]
MKLMVCMFLFLGGIALGNAQQYALKIVNLKNGTEKIIKENRRVRLKTIDGDKYTGRLHFQDADVLKIKGVVIPVSKIKKIKRHPLLLSIIIDGTLYYSAAAFLFTGLFFSAFMQDSSYLALLFPGALSTVAAAFSPSIIPAYKLKNGWSYEVIQVE